MRLVKVDLAHDVAGLGVGFEGGSAGILLLSGVGEAAAPGEDGAEAAVGREGETLGEIDGGAGLSTVDVHAPTTRTRTAARAPPGHRGLGAWRAEGACDVMPTWTSKAGGMCHPQRRSRRARC